MALSICTFQNQNNNFTFEESCHVYIFSTKKKGMILGNSVK